MADVINLNRARKAAARDAKAKTAEENRVRFGRTKAQKERDRRVSEIEAKRLDGNKREE